MTESSDDAELMEGHDKKNMIEVGYVLSNKSVLIALPDNLAVRIVTIKMILCSLTTFI